MNTRWTSSLALLVLMTSASIAQAQSQFPSTAGTTLPNVHFVARGKGIVFRGSNPTAKLGELSRLQVPAAGGKTSTVAVDEILIYRDEVRAKDVAAELAAIQGKFAPARIHHIAMGYKDLGPFQGTCEKTVDALKLLVDAYNAPGRVMYFHCSLGEDRTGYLAGLFRQLVDPRAKLDGTVKNGAFQDGVFHDDLCEHGYEMGNPGKFAIASAIRKDLTTAFLRISWMIANGKLSINHVDRAICSDRATVTAAAAALQSDPHYAPKGFICKKSSLLH